MNSVNVLSRPFGGWAASFWQALRRVRSARGLSVSIVGVLALGVVASAAIFSMVDAVLFRPLPWKDAARLVRIYAVLEARRAQPGWSSRWDRQGVRSSTWTTLQGAEVFESIALWSDSREMYEGSERKTVIRVMPVSANFLAVLGPPEVSGPGFEPEREAGTARQIVISREWWLQRFGGANVIGETVALWEVVGTRPQLATVVGILGPEFRFDGQQPHALLAIRPWEDRGRFAPLGRMKPGTGVDVLTPRVSDVLRQAETAELTSARLVRLDEDRRSRSDSRLWVLFGGALLLLATAAAGAAGLLLSQVQVRRHEVAVRMAMGATTKLIRQQLSLEVMILVSVACAIGMLLVWVAVPALTTLSPAELLRLERPEVSSRVLLFAVAGTLVIAVLFGAVPVLALSGMMIRDGLAESRVVLRSGRRWHRVVTACQVAFAVTLLIGASLFAESLLRLDARPLGFEPRGLVIASTRVTDWAVASEPAKNAVLVDRVIDQLKILPAVESVAAAITVPMSGRAVDVGFGLPGAAPAFRADQNVVSPEYFRTLGMPLLKGTGMKADGRGQLPVETVVSESFERDFMGGHALGRRLNLQDGRVLEVVGVVPDTLRERYREAVLPTFYVLKGPTYGLTQFVVRTADSARFPGRAIASAIEGVSSQLAVTSVRPMSDVLADALADDRFRAVVAGVFAMTALTLAAVGLYGLAARVVIDRRREIGLRVALGADAGRIRRFVFGETLAPVSVGAVVGALAAAGLANALSTLVFGVSTAAPRVYLTGATVMLAAAFVAAWRPCQRALRISVRTALDD